MLEGQTDRPTFAWTRQLGRSLVRSAEFSIATNAAQDYDNDIEIAIKRSLHDKRRKREWSNSTVRSCHATDRWIEDLYLTIKIDWLGEEDARNLWLASPHTKEYPDFRPDPRSDPKSYQLWLMRRPEYPLSGVQTDIQPLLATLPNDSKCMVIRGVVYNLSITRHGYNSRDRYCTHLANFFHPYQAQSGRNTGLYIPTIGNFIPSMLMSIGPIAMMYNPMQIHVEIPIPANRAMEIPQARAHPLLSLEVENKRKISQDRAKLNRYPRINKHQNQRHAPKIARRGNFRKR